MYLPAPRKALVRALLKAKSLDMLIPIALKQPH